MIISLPSDWRLNRFNLNRIGVAFHSSFKSRCCLNRQRWSVIGHPLGGGEAGEGGREGGGRGEGEGNPVADVTLRLNTGPCHAALVTDERPAG